MGSRGNKEIIMMNIFSLQFLYQPSSPTSYTYEAYYINNGIMTSLGIVTDLEKTFACQDEFIGSNLFVFNGDLYEAGTKVRTSGDITSLTGRTTSSSYYGYFVEDGKLYRFNSSMTVSQVGSDTNWVRVCGYSGTSNNYRAFAEKSDGLYYISSTTPTQISTLTGWTKIVGYGSTSSSAYRGYGINNGKLYFLYANSSGASQVGTDTTWTDITGSREGSNAYGYGINGGKLYNLSGSSPSQIGTGTTWTKVSGTASSNAYALGLNNGGLYLINGTTATQVGNSTDWENCSGFAYTNDEIALAYDSTALYGVAYDGTITKLMDGDWVYCGENYSSSNAYGLAIRRFTV